MPYLRAGEYFEVIATTATPVDSVIVSGSLAGVTKFNYSVGDTVLAYTEGVYELPATVSAAQTVGKPVYATSAGAIAFASASGSVVLGKLLRAAASGDTSVLVLVGNTAIAAS